MKGIAGFYYVSVAGSGVYECKAKGAFRSQSIKPLVGDEAEITVLDEEAKLGNITAILPRKNVLVRPAAANISQALVIFAAARPKPNLNLLDRFLVAMERQEIPAVICFNKRDLVTAEEQRRLREIYAACGYEILFTSASQEEGIGELRQLLGGKTTVVAGPSGVGKSSLINLLQTSCQVETGAISEKIDRGRHTTRHSELFALEDGYICDTPGFSSLYIPDFEKEELQNYFPEFQERRQFCRFLGCQHLKEPDCGVKEALVRGEISQNRYENYVLLYEELKQRRKY